MIIAITFAIFKSPLFLDKVTPKNNVIANNIIEANTKKIIFSIFLNIIISFYSSLNTTSQKISSLDRISELLK